MNILIRADSSSVLGTGHLMRDLVLAKKYAKNSASITFASQDLEGNLNHKILDAGYSLEILQSNSKKELVKLVRKLGVHLLVIDHYGINYKKEKYIKDKTDVKILSFDDTYEKHHCDVLLNHNISADEKRYENLVPRGCKIKCGSKYTLLREEFYVEKNKSYKKSKKVKTVFLAMGGADTASLNIQILKVLEKFDVLKVNVVTTSANEHLPALETYAEDKEWINLQINSTKIAKLMRKSDFAIVTPSVTLNEVFFMKIPFVAVKTADNQEDMYTYLKSKNLDVLRQFDEKKLSFHIFLKVHTIKMKNFTVLTRNEKQLVFKWRNHKNIRQWMYKKDKISQNEHEDYIESLMHREDREYFLVKQNKKNIGVVDLTNMNKVKKVGELGIYTKPNTKGMGSVLMQTILKYSFLYLNLNDVKANVYVGNEAAIALYKKFGFEIQDKKNGLYYMQLKRGEHV